MKQRWVTLSAAGRERKQTDPRLRHEIAARASFAACRAGARQQAASLGVVLERIEHAIRQRTGGTTG
jgi:hypothetical protein